ncbi:hypothetical protein G6F62_015278 [Rhizopus arrhizus]|nr:hypothetical protein G6F62_015278 [Rhizopus arrhizus]
MTKHLRREVEPQRRADHPLPAIARRPRADRAQPRDPRGRRHQQRAQHPRQGHVRPHRQQGARQRNRQTTQHPQQHVLTHDPIHVHS